MSQDSFYSPMTNYSQPVSSYSSIPNNSNEHSNTVSYSGNAPSYSGTMNLAPRDLATIHLVNKVLIQAMAIQPMQGQSTQQALHLNELSLFYRPPNDDNIYHITCRNISSQNIVDNDYDYEFFYQDSNTKYHVMCKLLPYPLIVNLLNKEIYGRDFDVNELNRKYLLNLHQKLNLEQNLKKALPFYLYIPEREMGSDSNGNTGGNIESDMMQSTPVVDNSDYFDNVNFNDYVSGQDIAHPQQFDFNNI